MARDRIPTVNLHFLKLVKVVHISLLLKVDFVQVFVYISYHLYVFICILRFLGFICVTCMYSYFTLMYPYVTCRSSYPCVTRILPIERFSFECRKTKTKVITLANHTGHRQYIEPIKTRSNYMWLTQSAGKCMRARHNWLWFYF